MAGAVDVVIDEAERVVAETGLTGSAFVATWCGGKEGRRGGEGKGERRKG